jgi:phospholipid-transporting ATPase
MVQISCTNSFSYNYSDISEKLILTCDPRYVLYTAFTLTTAITEWSSLLYTVLYTSLPTIVVGILDKDLNKATLLAYPKLYGSGQRDDKYNVNLFVLNMLEALWQSLAVFYLPYFAYRRSTIDMSSLGDLWALAPVIVVNMQLAMDIIRWNWIIHAFVWGTIAATTVCLFVIDSIWVLPGYG